MDIQRVEYIQEIKYNNLIFIIRKMITNLKIVDKRYTDLSKVNPSIYCDIASERQ